jgi:5-oxoprolinase (ATP-hydrolysing) subunit A
VRIDLNADVGESYGAWAMGQDEELVPLMTSVNIACGAHAGDPLVMARTVALALEHGVAIGAHPGYPDRDGFGRRDISFGIDELEASIIFQLGALSGFVRDAGAELQHVKPHGALYNRAAHDADVAAAVARAVRRFDRSLVLVGLAGSRLLDAGRVEGLAVRGEAFADRAYEPDGSLRSRRHPDAVLPDAEAAAEQAVSIVVLGKVEAIDGTPVSIEADTLCIHGDTPGASEYARRVRAELDAAGVTVASLPRRGRRRRG